MADRLARLPAAHPSARHPPSGSAGDRADWADRYDAAAEDGHSPGRGSRPDEPESGTGRGPEYPPWLDHEAADPSGAQDYPGGDPADDPGPDGLALDGPEPDDLDGDDPWADDLGDDEAGPGDADRDGPGWHHGSSRAPRPLALGDAAAWGELGGATSRGPYRPWFGADGAIDPWFAAGIGE